MGPLFVYDLHVSTIYTVGHSTHPIEYFVELLWRHRIGAVADVRIQPGSRRLPQFNRDALDEALAAESIRYEHFPELGGRREPRPETPNHGWDTPAFQGYADHMETREFEAGVERLLELADERITAIMCAEGLWWRCHRRLLADALVVRGRHVHHIGGDGALTNHRLTPFAVADGERLTYPPAQESLNLPSA
jgi:uncharacterized protein (DUF488 family)